MPSEIITKFILLSISLLFICALLFSCVSAHIEPKPQQVIIKGSHGIPDYNKLHSIDIVTHYPLPNNVKKILIQYATRESQPDDTLLLWNQAIQKALLRNGFLIVQQDNSDDLFKEENSVTSYDAICIVEHIQLNKQTEIISFEQVIDNNQAQHQIYYYIVSISVCISVNQIIIWQGDVTITSFDLLKNKNLIQEPTLHKTVTYDYSYSKKLKRWIKDSPTILITDNFSKYYNDENIHLHKKELIQLAVSTLFNQLKVVQ
ncbi:MAG: hypothetical protein N3F66_05585 [Spirochaetes bacterium]|nr:hypothetical protein [Spirochaetota bacterium]